MRVLELFSGYGTASFALKQLEIDFEIIGYSDIDKYANQIFWNNHWKKVKPLRLTNNPPRELGDVKDINPNELEDFDLLTGGFPCQAFSVAGKGKGENDDRGRLFREIIRIAEVKKPRYMLLENVKGLLSDRHKKTFEKVLSELRRIGYHVHWKVLDTKKLGVPQSRKRVFFVCFRDHTEHFNFQYPRDEELKLILGDILEKEVDKKYYLSETQINRLFASGFRAKQVSNAIRAGGRNSLDGKHTWDVVKVGNVNPSGKGMNGNVYSGNVAPALTTNKGEGPKMLIVDDTQGFDGIRLYDKICPSLRSSRPGLKIYQRGRGFNPGGVKEICPTISSNYWHQNNFLMEGETLRRLTPRECFRLQGFINDEINIEGISNAQLYKLAGNGQSVNVVRKIFENMFWNTPFLNNTTEVQ